MNWICFDTSGEKGCVTLIKDGKIGGSIVLSKVYGHNETLMPTISLMLKQGKLNPSDLDGVGFVRGPGTFTGLRIGAAVAYGFKAANPFLELKGFSSLYLLNRQLNDKSCHYNLVLIDARRKQVYGGCFKDGKPLCDYAAVSPSQLSEFLKEQGINDTSFTITGSGVEKYRNVITDQFPDAVFEDSEPCLSRALASEILKPLNHEPSSETLLYIRKSDAELNKDRKRS